ncbi:MAG: hypothetical protein COA79_23740 [Planctomycetota bacterium]|nr:MAG: hypothetical protein COA79_23740 [Planctomycetota bacterium]
MVSDARNILYGKPIPSEGYCEQPNIIEIDSDTWLCVITTGKGKEGQKCQHIVAMQSKDQGTTWINQVSVEPDDGPEASYSVLLKTNFNRIYCFYNYNSTKFDYVIADPNYYKEGKCKRVDMLGDYVFKYSDDHGLSWSEKRVVVPIRPFEIDKKNAYQGEITYGWNVSQPVINNNIVMIPYNKIGAFGKGHDSVSEGVFLASDNILSEKDIEKINWQTLPEGTEGIKPPKNCGSISEEHSLTVLNNGELYDIFRTTGGYAAFTQSRDNGKTWSIPEYALYRNGYPIKQPRAANIIFKCKNNKYLYWYHFNSWNGYNFHDGAGSRNLAWMCGGVEEDGTIKWSQPEIILYHPDFYKGPSYPHLLESNGEYFISETVKSKAFVHQLDKSQLERLWSQHLLDEVSQNGLKLEYELGSDNGLKLPQFNSFVIRDYWKNKDSPENQNSGFSIELAFRLNDFNVDENIIDNLSSSKKGFRVSVGRNNTIRFQMSDGRTENTWSTDFNSIKINHLHHLVINIDGGASTITFVLDGRLLDGGDARYYGYGRISPVFDNVNGAEVLSLNQNAQIMISKIRIYNRSLSTSESIGNWKSFILALKHDTSESLC